MKNFYRRLPILPNADINDALRVAVELLDADGETQQAAQHILLDPHRKKVYDNSHKALTTIGQLRANLGLVETAGWSAEDAVEFKAPRVDSVAELEKLREAKAAKLLRDNIDALKVVGATAAILISIIAIGIWASGSLGSSTDHQNRAESQSTNLTTPNDLSGTTQASDPQSSGREQGNSNVTAPPEVDAAALGHDLENRIKNWWKKDSIAENSPPINANRSTDDASSAASLPLPPTGELRVGTDFLFAKEKAPLRVVTASHSGHYVIKLTDVGTDKEVALFFLRAAETLNVDVPVGTYNLRYAYGESWYGSEKLFGPKTRCARADTTFRFWIRGDYAEGHRIELIKQLDGNLETEEIPLSEF